MNNLASMSSEYNVIANTLLSIGDDSTRKAHAQAALSDFMEMPSGRPRFDHARQLMQALDAGPRASAALEPAASLLSARLTSLEASYADALRWPQVESFGDRAIGKATDPLFDLLDEDKLDIVYDRALSILPVQWFRLQAGLTVAESLSPDAVKAYSQSSFCLQAEDRVKNFALSAYSLLTCEREKLQPLTSSDSVRVVRAKNFLLQLHPSFAEEMEEIEGDHYTTEQWHQAVDQQVCRLFDNDMVSDAEILFATACGQQLLLKMPAVTRDLKQVEQNHKLCSIAEDCVRQVMQKVENQAG